MPKTHQHARYSTLLSKHVAASCRFSVRVHHMIPAMAGVFDKEPKFMLLRDVPRMDMTWSVIYRPNVSSTVIKRISPFEIFPEVKSGDISQCSGWESWVRFLSSFSFAFFVLLCFCIFLFCFEISMLVFGAFGCVIWDWEVTLAGLKYPLDRKWSKYNMPKMP